MPASSVETAGLLPLPDGNWVERFGRPCPACRATVFTVALVRHPIPNGYREAVESYCPTCPLASHPRSVRKTILGRHDLRAGTITLTHYVPRPNESPTEG